MWAELKSGLYSQDIEWVKRQAHQVIALTSHVLQFHRTQCCGDSGSDGFLTDTQTHDLVTGGEKMVNVQIFYTTHWVTHM